MDGKLLFTQNGPTLNFGAALLSGSHFLVTKAWDATGLSFRSDRHFTVYDGTPGSTCPTAVGNAVICVTGLVEPASPVHIVANANVGPPPTSAQLYIDGNLVVNNYACNASSCETGNTAVDPVQPLAAGPHYLVFKVWTIDGGPIETSQKLTVQ